VATRGAGRRRPELVQRDLVSTSNATVTKNTITGYTQQYFRYVRFGARRIGVTTTDGTFDPVAFINPSGAYTVVVKALAGGTFGVQGLPAGTYRLRYTTAAEVDAAPPDQVITAGQTVNAAIPAAGVIVVFGTGAGAGPPIHPRPLRKPLHPAGPSDSPPT
jgi:hypothetical protein